MSTTSARAIAYTAMLLASVACSARTATSRGAEPAPMPAGLQVRQSSTGRVVSFSALVAEASRADVVFFGEQHDDPETHFAEYALLDGIARTRTNVVVSLEMFERDVQSVVDDYLAGRITEVDFLARSRPWPRYATDYRALVLLARARGWPVVASNVPRSIASAIGRTGLAALDSLPASSRAHAARDIACPRDAYYDRFADQMKGHTAGAPGTAPDVASARATTDRFYEAQCVKDETMAESIVRARTLAGADAIVVHFNGAFHSDHGLGTAARVTRRIWSAKSLVITAVPVQDPARAPSADFAVRAAYVILTKAPAK